MRRPRMLMLALAALAAGRLARPHDAGTATPVQRGKYLVTTSGCNDCHTPWHMGPNGPEPDMSRMLSGHPQEIVVSAPGKLTEPWIGGMIAHQHRLVRPLGHELHRQPDARPGDRLWREWTEEQFIADDPHRPPPRPGPADPAADAVAAYGQMTDDDLKAIFAYLQTIPPIKNKVPDPLPPAQ